MRSSRAAFCPRRSRAVLPPLATILFFIGGLTHILFAETRPIAGEMEGVRHERVVVARLAFPNECVARIARALMAAGEDHPLPGDEDPAHFPLTPATTRHFRGDLRSASRPQQRRARSSASRAERPGGWRPKGQVSKSTD